MTLLNREKHPKLLKKDDRGKDTDKSAKPLPYGATKLVEKLESTSDEEDEEESENGKCPEFLSRFNGNLQMTNLSFFSF